MGCVIEHIYVVAEFVTYKDMPYMRLIFNKFNRGKDG
jgi:hypothetical protein